MVQESWFLVTFVVENKIFALTFYLPFFIFFKASLLTKQMVK